jgi:hypothetical protein
LTILSFPSGLRLPPSPRIMQTSRPPCSLPFVLS